MLKYADTKQFGIKLVTFRRRVLNNWNKSTYTRQLPSFIYYTMKNLIHSPTTEPNFTRNTVILFTKWRLFTNIIVYSINIYGYDTIEYKQLV